MKYEDGTSFRTILQSIKVNVWLHTIIDMKRIYDKIMMSKLLRWFCLMNGIADNRPSHYRYDISNVVWVYLRRSIDENLTMRNGNRTIIETLQIEILTDITEQ